jgi:hypothetical protein
LTPGSAANTTVTGGSGPSARAPLTAQDGRLTHAIRDWQARRKVIREELDSLPVVILEGGWSQQRASRALVEGTPLG